MSDKKTTPNILTVYTSPSCRQCIVTKRWLDSRGVPYKEEDATTPENLSYIRTNLGFNAAPVCITPYGEAWFGFDPFKLEEYVEAHYGDFPPRATLP